MIASAGNNAISDKDPASYLPECAKTLGSSADAIFDSNLMPKPSSFNYAQSSYEEFLKARSKIVTDTIEKLCAGDHL
jgi:hypothetical protein